MKEKTNTCEGGCSCGEVRYEVKGNPLIVHACHCRWCQRQTGGPHVINALYESDRIKLVSGKVDLIKTPSPSGNGQTIARCPKCRVAVWSHYYFGGRKERVSFLRAGTLDNPDRMPPDVHIYTSTKLPWYVIPPDVYSVPEFYDLQATWSSDARKRLKALMADLA